MKGGRASQTARGTAALRALESEKSAEDRICDDPLARQFVDPSFLLQVRLFSRLSDWLTLGGSRFVVYRARYIDDHVRECLRAATTQVVLLGAGWDSRAYRAERSTGANFLEVDHPATQAGKIERVKQLFGQTPRHVAYIPIDLNSETLDKLLANGFDSYAKALFIWEGVVAEYYSIVHAEVA